MNFPTTDKHIFVVLGMPRSGTSVITRMLQASGVDLGNHLMPANNNWNPKGFWEDEDIVNRINREVFFAINYDWMSLSLVDHFKHTPKTKELQQFAKQLLTERMQTATHWGFKDPRTVKLLFFWQAIFHELQLQEHYVIALRNPLASAYSHQKLRGVSIEEGLLLWLMHLIPALRDTQHKKRVVVSYDTVMQDPVKQMTRLHDQLALPFTLQTAEVTAFKQYLDKTLHHFSCTQHDLSKHPASLMYPLCLRLYEFLQAIAQDEIRFEDDGYEHTWQALLAEFEAQYPAYQYIDALHKQNKSLKRKLRTIHRSIPWKMTFPLRLLDDFLRARRRKTRQHKRLVSTYAE